MKQALSGLSPFKTFDRFVALKFKRLYNSYHQHLPAISPVSDISPVVLELVILRDKFDFFALRLIYVLINWSQLWIIKEIG